MGALPLSGARRDQKPARPARVEQIFHIACAAELPTVEICAAELPMMGIDDYIARCLAKLLVQQTRCVALPYGHLWSGCRTAGPELTEAV